MGTWGHPGILPAVSLLFPAAGMGEFLANGEISVPAWLAGEENKRCWVWVPQGTAGLGGWGSVAAAVV